MNNPLTDVYSIICREFPDIVDHFGIRDNKEISAFLHYNAKNMMYKCIDNYMYHNVIFKNLDNGNISRIYVEGAIYLFPKGNEKIEVGNDMVAFKIGDNTKSITINANGLFIEQFDRSGSIITRYYDNAALEEISKDGMMVGNIDYIENYIEKMDIMPDRIITGNIDKKMDENGLRVVSRSVDIKETENNEVISQVNIPMDEGRSFYSIYYEYMKLQNYFQVDSDTKKQGKSY